MSEGMTLPDQVVLLCMTGRPRHVNLNLALAGAALIELARRGRVTVDQGNGIVVSDPASTDDVVLDRVLQSTGGARRRWAPELIRTLSRTRAARDALLERLVARGVLDRRDRRSLWVFRRTEYVARDPRLQSALRERLRAVVLGDGPVDPDSAALVALMHGTRGVFRFQSVEEARSRRERLAWISKEGLTAPDGDEATRHAIGVVVRATAVAAQGDTGAPPGW